MGDGATCHYCRKTPCACVEEPAARIAALEAALKPFVAVLDGYKLGLPEAKTTSTGHIYEPIPSQHFLDARAVLAGGSAALDAAVAKRTEDLARSNKRLREGLTRVKTYLAHKSDGSPLETCSNHCPLCIAEAALEAV